MTKKQGLLFSAIKLALAAVYLALLVQQVRDRWKGLKEAEDFADV